MRGELLAKEGRVMEQREKRTRVNTDTHDAQYAVRRWTGDHRMSKNDKSIDEAWSELV